VLAILPEFEAGLTDIEGFSHLVVLWEFDRSHGFELLGTPPSDNRAHGVFATRSPRRPNPIGLTIVELLRREGVELHVRGVDMLDGTPILDIKPLMSGIAVEKLRRGWLAEAEARRRDWKSALVPTGDSGRAGKKQVPHRAFSPVRNDKGYSIVWK
jgi:tRNA-Thr(GGU) m(6)t(6)A37 methyltransferase TsaA